MARPGRHSRTGSTSKKIHYAPPLPATVEKMVAGGDGLVRLNDGRACFVPGAFTGDRVAISLLEARQGYARASQWSLLEAGPSRQQPPCALAGRCGGCDWMGMRPDDQLAAKHMILVEALRRTGNIHWDAQQVQLHPSSDPVGYRNRMRLHLAPDGKPGLLGRASHQLVPVAECIVASPALQAALTTLLGLHQAAPEALRAFDQVELRAAGSRPSLLLMRTQSTGRSGRRRPPLPDARALAPYEQAFNLRLAVPGTTDTIALPAAAFDRLKLDDSLFLDVLPGDFSQVNWQVNQSIIDSLITGVRMRGLTSFADLYCGAGNFTLPLLVAGLTGHGIENNPGAIRGARLAAAAQGLPATAFVTADAMTWARQRNRQLETVELVIIDPPRTGIVSGIEAVASLATRNIFFCACDPVTGARDIGRLHALGFGLDSVALYDMFPQTHHFEVVAWMSRRQK